MNKNHFPLAIVVILTLGSVSSCNSQSKPAAKGNNPTAKNTKATAASYKEGEDYTEFQRVRILDKTGFSQPVEAFSLLIPKGWKYDGAIIWNQPGTSCAGINQFFKATSPDGKYSFEVFPYYTWGYNSDPQMQQFNQNNTTPTCGYGQPMDARNYFNAVFAKNELGNPTVVDIKENKDGLAAMRAAMEKGRQELMSYGAAGLEFYPSAIHANVKWNDGSKGIVTCGVTISEITMANNYTGTYSKIYTSVASEKIVFRYPESEQNAANMLSVIMASMRTNTSWKKSVDDFWLSVRQQKQRDHIGRIQMMDEQTRQIGANAIKKGQENLNAMDQNMRNWERSQQSQDRIHTSFIKAIREVETYRDENGVVELSSGYNHAWSRSDGSSFIMSNNPNFDPSSVFQDQRWKEMKPVQ